MPNTKLYGKKFKIPTDIIEAIKKQLIITPSGDGIKRAKNIAYGDGYITYQSLERLKNYFENDVDLTNKESKDRYLLAGGDKMKNFVYSTLDSSRSLTKKREQFKSDMGIGKTRDNVMPQQNTRTDDMKL
jgi:hypothetical protein